MDYGITDSSIPGDIARELREHGWFVGSVNEDPEYWQKRADVVRGALRPASLCLMDRLDSAEAALEDIRKSLETIHVSDTVDPRNLDKIMVKRICALLVPGTIDSRFSGYCSDLQVWLSKRILG